MAINPWAILAVGASMVKAYGTIYSGYAMAAYYEGKADLALLQGRTKKVEAKEAGVCLLYTSPSPRDATLSRMPSSA